MNAALWELAGPRLFVRRIGEATLAGKSIVLLTRQSHAVPALGQQLAGCLTRAEYPTSYVDPLSHEPIADLLAVIPGEIGPKTMRTVFERLADRTLVVAPIANQSGWFDFMSRFQHAARSYPAMDRPRIIMVREGSAPVSDDVAVEYHEWDLVVSSADIESLVQAWIPPKFADSVLRQVLVRTIVEIGLSDVDLVHDLCVLSRREVASPIGFLEGWARINGSHPDPIWIDGTVRDHVLKETTGDEFRRRVYHRLWKAQAKVLLPWVEEGRQTFLPKLYNVLPEMDDYGVERSDFEIGPICFWLRTRNPTNPYFPLFERFRKIRNHLAHLRFFPLDELTSDISFIEKYVPR